MITSFELQAPPRAVDASASTSGPPNVTSIRLNFPSEKNPSCFESGDQNGKIAFSVPFRARAAGEVSVRTQIIGRAFSAFATMAISCPFGERIAVAVSNTNAVPSGGVMSEYRSVGTERWRIHQNTGTAPRISTVTTTAASSGHDIFRA